MKRTIFCMVVAMPLLVQAQNYSIDFFSIDGGGGTSSGGSFVLHGAIGQPDAGTLRGGPYLLEGGFLSGIFVVQTVGAPLLTIHLSGNNAVISWAADASTGFLLEETSAIATPSSWTPSSAILQTSGNSRSATVPANSGIRFFRLRKP